MLRKNRKCERCEFFQTRQGKGRVGDCKRMPVTVEKRLSDWCGEFKVNLEKYHTDGKKIYTRIDTVQKNSAGMVDPRDYL